MTNITKNLVSRTRIEVRLVYKGIFVAWFCCLFMIYKMNLPFREVSSAVFVGICLAAPSSIALGLAMRMRCRRRCTKDSSDALKSAQSWRAANFVSFSCAILVAFCGVALRFLGSPWLTSGIFFGLSLFFILLWRPREFPISADLEA